MKVLCILTIISSSAASAFKDDQFHGKIVDGVLINITEAPWMTSMYESVYQNYGWVTRLKCGGSIVGRNEIITAAHCIPDRDRYARIFFRAGSANRELGSLHYVDYLRQHPLKKPFDRSYDVVFVRVKEPFKFGKTLKPIRVRNSEPKSGSVGMVAGWGLTRPVLFHPSNPKELRAVNLTIWDNNDCRSKFNITFTLINYPEVVKCMKNIGEGSSKSSCFGDSGGGVVYQNELVGVLTSLRAPLGSAVNCDIPKAVNIYTSAVKIKSWIEEMIKKSEKKGRRKI